MKTLRKYVVISIIIAVAALVLLKIVCNVFAFSVWTGVVIGIVIVLGCAFNIGCEIRDYRFYQQLSIRMNGKTPREKLDVVLNGLECWLVYATCAEVRELAADLRKIDKSERRDYFFERAYSHGKLNY